MNNLISSLQNADRICKRANAHFQQAEQIEQQLASFAGERKKSIIKWVVFGMVVWTVAGMVGGLLGAIPYIGIVLYALTCMAGMGGGAYIGVNGYRNEKTAMEARIAGIQRKAREERALGHQVLEENYDDIAFLPDDYWNPQATSYLLKTVSAQRVNSLAEALDRYDAQLHRWHVEQTNENILSQQQAQTAHLKSIRTSSKVSAAANVTNTIFNIASKL